MENEVLFNNLGEQWKLVSSAVKSRMDNLFESSSFINGPDVSEFESNFAKYIGVNHSCGVSNGTDAIKLCIQALVNEKYINGQGNVGIIIPANTFIATLLGAEMALPEAEFVLVDCDNHYQIDPLLLEEALTENRGKWDDCIIIPVHLYGHSCDMEAVMGLAERFNCWVVEDSSQAHGTRAKIGDSSPMVGSIGHLSAFSMYPGKNLGAAGDAGVITTNDSVLYESIQKLKNWGSREKYHYDFKGCNNRLDSIQAIVVDEKLKYLDQWNDMRNLVAKKYQEGLRDSGVILPQKADYCDNQTHHIYPIRISVSDRSRLMGFLGSCEIQCGVHYPVPIEITSIYGNNGWYNKKTRLFSQQMISLPMHPFLTDEDISRVVNTVNKYCSLRGKSLKVSG
jgi:dTDP-4-amino-4,6-dideoxygalactose transaminase